MSKTLALGVVLGATVSGGFSTSLGLAKNTLNALGKTVKGLDSEFKAQRKEQALFDKGGLVGPTRQIANFEKLTKTLKEAKVQSESLRKSLLAHKEAKAYRAGVVNDMRGTAMTGAAIAAPLIGSVRVFMDQDTAATNAKMAFMTSSGGVSAAFDDIRKKAVDLGNTLPGTTADFLGVSRVLKEQGLSDDIIKNGALESAAKLNVLLGTSQEFGAEFVAKLVEARGLKDSELGAAADIVQRARFAFGMKPEDMKDTMKYDAPMMAALGIRGKENLSKNFALQGMLATNGVEGAQAGNVLKNILLRTGEGVTSVAGATKGNKAVARSQMEQAGVKFDFYDAKGNFKGLREMTVEMEKLKVIKEKLGDGAAMNVANEIFGAENVSAAMIIAEKGSAGFDEAIKKMDEQASMQQRLEEQSKSLSVIWDNLTGTAVNLAAGLGSVFGPDLASGFKSANGFISNTLMPWVENNKGLIKSVVTLGVGFVGMRLALGGVKLAYSSTIGEMFRWGKTVTEGYKAYKKFSEINQLLGKGKMFSFLQTLKVPTWLLSFGSKGFGFVKTFGAKVTKDFVSFGKGLWTFSKAFGSGALGLLKGVGQGLLGLGKAFGTLGRLMGGGLVRGMMMAGRAVIFVGRALLMNPIGLIITGIAIAGYLVYKNWDKLKPMFISVWNTAKTKAVAAWNTIKSTWGGIKAWFSAKIDGVKSIFKNLPSAFAEFGRNMIQGLIDGVTARWDALKSKISDLANMVSDVFMKKTGINSPSRLFARHGGFLMDGLGVGIGRNGLSVLKQMGTFAQSLGNVFAPKLQVPEISTGKVRAASSVATRTQGVGTGAGASAGGNSEYHFHITQAQGEDAESLARRIMRMVQDAQGARRRSYMGDFA